MYALTPDCGRDASVCLGSGLFETVEGLFRVSELTLSMSLAIWFKTWLTFVGDVDELFISEVRRSTTDDNVFDKQRRSKKFPLFFLWFTPPGILFRLHNYRPADLVGRHIFFTFGGRRAVQGEKNYILYNSFRSK